MSEIYSENGGDFKNCDIEIWNANYSESAYSYLVSVRRVCVVNCSCAYVKCRTGLLVIYILIDSFQRGGKDYLTALAFIPL